MFSQERASGVKPAAQNLGASNGGCAPPEPTITVNTVIYKNPPSLAAVGLFVCEAVRSIEP